MEWVLSGSAPSMSRTVEPTLPSCGIYRISGQMNAFRLKFTRNNYAPALVLGQIFGHFRHPIGCITGSRAGHSHGFCQLIRQCRG